MTTATITDITQHRLGKVADFSKWRDSRIKTRATLLGIIEERGVEALGDQNSGMFRTAFPNGYDPLNHAEDNLAVVRAEGVRRGVFASV